MTRGTITKIDPIKYSRNGGSFIRVYFKLADGSWAETDLVPGYRNYERWKNLLVIGLDLDGLELKTKGRVNADSYPRIFKEIIPGHWEQQPDGSMAYIPEREVIKPAILEELKPVLRQDKLL